MKNQKLFDTITDFIKNHFKRVDCQMVLNYFDLTPKEAKLCLARNGKPNLRAYIELIKDECILNDIKRGLVLDPNYHLSFEINDKDNIGRRIKKRYHYSILQLYRLYKLGCLDHFIANPTDYKSSFIYALEFAITQRFREFDLIETLSKEAHIDISNLHRTWKKAYNEPLNEFLMYLRIKEARRLFNEKGYTAKQIPLMVGIGAVQTLNSTHRNLYGITFSEYMRTQTYRKQPVVNNGKYFYIVEGHKTLILEKITTMEEFNPLNLHKLCGFSEGVFNTMLTDIFGDTCIPYLKQFWLAYRGTSL